jgi:hypothetical protein
VLQGQVGALELENPSLASPLHPLARCPLAHAQDVGDLLLGPPFLFEFEGSKTPSLAPVGSFF